MRIASDLIILVLPMPVLKSLQLPRQQNIALMAVFAVGIFVVVTTIIRLRSLLVISKSSDPTYDVIGTVTWSAIECNVAIICVCRPPIKPLLSRYIPSVFGSSIAAESKAVTNRFLRRSATAAIEYDDEQVLHTFNRDCRTNSDVGHNTINTSADNLNERKWMESKSQLCYTKNPS
ncbi:hypothetical protein BGW36DRAFT_355420 [Talaromyces proteolyticus]|uniref:Rhodopsin domain-containing protein n=1 Tax=Talaromyces proteolyticus TaxID=1131652 RepID=A0AAD4L1S0_9EURO|nr:uncharacterized protein BGW36DRAFT_355420 [Talaromyces proteolyticus]KAH8704041.1 hypothetical protein BGW36DRAFT_355420 [Talaromyces proteolyticus]